MNAIELAMFILKAWFLYLVLWLLGNGIRQREFHPIPKRLMLLKDNIEKGKPHRRYWDTLRAEPMFDDHYRKVPGRLSCDILPHQVNGEQIWKLRVGFKSTANEQPSKYITIPVYKDGQIYDV